MEVNGAQVPQEQAHAMPLQPCVLFFWPSALGGAPSLSHCISEG